MMLSGLVTASSRKRKWGYIYMNL